MYAHCDRDTHLLPLINTLVDTSLLGQIKTKIIATDIFVVFIFKFFGSIFFNNNVFKKMKKKNCSPKLDGPLLPNAVNVNDRLNRPLPLRIHQSAAVSMITRF